LHASDIRGAMGEIASYHKKDWLSPYFGPFKLCVFWPFFGLSLFVSLGMVLAIILLKINKIK
jgi:hypothetical protein